MSNLHPRRCKLHLAARQVGCTFLGLGTHRIGRIRFYRRQRRNNNVPAVDACAGGESVENGGPRGVGGCALASIPSTPFVVRCIAGISPGRIANVLARGCVVVHVCVRQGGCCRLMARFCGYWGGEAARTHGRLQATACMKMHFRAFSCIFMHSVCIFQLLFGSQGWRRMEEERFPIIWNFLPILFPRILMDFRHVLDFFWKYFLQDAS